MKCVYKVLQIYTRSQTQVCPLHCNAQALILLQCLGCFVAQQSRVVLQCCNYMGSSHFQWGTLPERRQRARPVAFHHSWATGKQDHDYNGCNEREWSNSIRLNLPANQVTTTTDLSCECWQTTMLPVECSDSVESFWAWRASMGTDNITVRNERFWQEVSSGSKVAALLFQWHSRCESKG